MSKKGACSVNMASGLLSTYVIIALWKCTWLIIRSISSRFEILRIVTGVVFGPEKISGVISCTIFSSLFDCSVS